MFPPINDSTASINTNWSQVLQIKTSTQVTSEPSSLNGIFISSASGTPTITIYNTTTGSGGAGNLIIDTFTPVSATKYEFKQEIFNSGIYVVIGGIVSCTVEYSKYRINF